MRVDGIIFASKQLLSDREGGSDPIDQVANAAALPGIVMASLAMPDIHYGYGLPIGGVIATREDTGVVTPGGVGYDINCGVRFLTSALDVTEIRPRLREIVDALFKEVPCGVGSRGKIMLNPSGLSELLQNGSRWAVAHGYGRDSDLELTEARGCLSTANPDAVSKKAFQRGLDQVGTLGAGNHFVEVQYVDEVYDEAAASAFGLFKDQVTIMVHSGSRGFGHQVCTDSLAMLAKAFPKFGIDIPDRQLICAPAGSKEGKEYVEAMSCAANYAWVNRQCLGFWAIEAFEKALGIGPAQHGLALLYDVAHNILKREKHDVDGKTLPVLVHRKGATRAFPPGHNELPLQYRSAGQPVIIPGDMGTASYVLVGTETAMQETFGSTCHGAGRLLSRHQAIKKAKGRQIDTELEKEGIIVRSASRKTLAEEMPAAYKDIDEVIRVVHEAGISKKVARLRPIGVIKG
ncbi:MAG: RtcB family protein [Candidatus Coatesbacteria bacterium]|nr:RtcB family protein [Candidatus Coatesbacteria bacterium]